MKLDHRSEAEVLTRTDSTSTSTNPNRQAPADTASRRACPRCQRPVKTADTPESVCPDCQTVVESEPISTRPRPRYGDSEECRARTGSRHTHLYTDKGLGTDSEISGPDGIEETPWRYTHESGLAYALGEIRRIGARLGIPRPELESAARLYHEVHARNHTEGRSIDGFVAACLLTATRQSPQRLPISEREIRRHSRSTRTQFRTARGELEVTIGVTIPPMDPHDFLQRIVSAVSAARPVAKCARELIKSHTSDNSAAGLSPRTLAAAAVHAAYELTECQERPTLERLSAVTDVAESTISQRKSALLVYSGQRKDD